MSLIVTPPEVVRVRTVRKVVSVEVTEWRKTRIVMEANLEGRHRRATKEGLGYA